MWYISRNSGSPILISYRKMEKSFLHFLPQRLAKEPNCGSFHSFLLLCYNSNGALLVEQDHYIEKDKLHDDKVATHAHTTYRICTLRAKCIIEMVFSLLCPTLYTIKVVLGQVRIQNKYLLHIALSRKYKFLLPRTHTHTKAKFLKKCGHLIIGYSNYITTAFPPCYWPTF